MVTLVMAWPVIALAIAVLVHYTCPMERISCTIIHSKPSGKRSLCRQS